MTDLGPCLGEGHQLDARAFPSFALRLTFLDTSLLKHAEVVWPTISSVLARNNLVMVANHRCTESFMAICFAEYENGHCAMICSNS